MEVGYHQPADDSGSAEAATLLSVEELEEKEVLRLTEDHQLRQAQPCTGGDAEAETHANAPGPKPLPLQHTASSRDRQRLLQELAAQFASQLPLHSKLSMAQLQGYLMMHRKDPYAAVHDVHQLLQQQHRQQEDQHATASSSDRKHISRES
jgi:hypothetical protein